MFDSLEPWEVDWLTWVDTDAGREAVSLAMPYPDMPMLLRAAFTAGWSGGSERMNRQTVALFESERGVR